MSLFVPQVAGASGWSDEDLAHMQLALDLARRAEAEGEVPVGAVLMRGAEILGTGWNRPVSSHDATWHAEVQAIREAGLKMRNYRLPGTTLYVTLEPCVMCAGALVTARVQRLVFGTRDLRFGGVRSKFRVADSELLNHRIDISEGLLAADCAQLLTGFFATRRAFGEME